MTLPISERALRLAIYGHASALPKSIADAFGGVYSDQASADVDAAIFAINPAAGIDQKTIDIWRDTDSWQVPRLVLVNSLEGSENDFDDAVLLANRVFDEIVTPYLVLHDDSGDPVALISLEDFVITNYSTQPPTKSAGDPEHRELVNEFAIEYREAIEQLGEGAFEAGLLFPAIPIDLKSEMGIDIARQYLSRLEK